MRRVFVLLICLLATVSLSVQAQDRRENRTPSDSPVSPASERSMVIRQERTDARDDQNSGRFQGQGRFLERIEEGTQERGGVYALRFSQEEQRGADTERQIWPYPRDGMTREQAERITSRLSLTREQQAAVARILSQRDMAQRERQEIEQNRERRAAAMENMDSAVKNLLSTEQYERFREIMRQQDLRNRRGGR